ncbi:MAG: recombinase family protein [Pseudobutyrivibrio sp.]|nr:recombinase family protein [Pseudobutyrivibrio sp.]
MRVALYTRVSTEQQYEKGNSIPEQLERLRAFCKAKDYLVVEEYVDGGFSGSNLERPSMARLIQDCQLHKFDCVIVYKLDRLSRSQKDTLFLIDDVFNKHGIDFISITESFDTSTPLGKAMLGILSVFAELERSNINQRMMMGRQARAKAGKWHGGNFTPIGYEYDSENERLKIIPEESIQVIKIYDMFLAGSSYNAIFNYMSEHYTHRYGSWKSGAGTVKEILSNPVYIGKIRWADIISDSTHDKIIDDETFALAQKRIAEIDASNLNRHISRESRHLLTGLLWCGECGSRMCFHQQRRQVNHKVYRYDKYACYNRIGNKNMIKGKCSVNSIDAKLLEEIVLEQVSELQFEEVNNIRECEQYDKKLKAIEKKILKLMDLYTLDKIDLPLLEGKLDDLRTEKEKLMQLSSKQEKSEFDRITPQELAQIINSGTLQEKRMLLNSLIDRIEVYSDEDIRIFWSFT